MAFAPVAVGDLHRDRACPPTMLWALERLGVDTSAAAPAMRQLVLGHGHPVGDARCALA